MATPIEILNSILATKSSQAGSTSSEDKFLFVTRADVGIENLIQLEIEKGKTIIEHFQNLKNTQESLYRKLFQLKDRDDVFKFVVRLKGNLTMSIFLEEAKKYLVDKLLLDTNVVSPIIRTIAVATPFEIELVDDDFLFCDIVSA